MLWKKARDALLANPKVGRSVMRTGLRNSRHGTNAACCCIILAALLFDWARFLFSFLFFFLCPFILLGVQHAYTAHA